jgi:hypothetical protein
MAEKKSTEHNGRAGDWVEVHGHGGKPSRRGQITEVLGTAGREHYRVRWDERHESIFYPAAGVVIVHRATRTTTKPRGEVKPKSSGARAKRRS